MLYNPLLHLLLQHLHFFKKRFTSAVLNIFTQTYCMSHYIQWDLLLYIDVIFLIFVCLLFIIPLPPHKVTPGIQILLKNKQRIKFLWK